MPKCLPNKPIEILDYELLNDEKLLGDITEIEVISRGKKYAV